MSGVSKVWLPSKCTFCCCIKFALHHMCLWLRDYIKYIVYTSTYIYIIANPYISLSLSLTLDMAMVHTK